MQQKFLIDIEPEALEDIQNAINYYNTCKQGLGKKFYITIDKQFSFLRTNFTLFAVRYDDIRCMKVKKIPYMIHYRILQNQQIVRITAVFCTFENPDKWGIKNG
jgi:toxin ParE1/3/4